MNAAPLRLALPVLAALALAVPALAQSPAAQAGAQALSRRCAASGGRPAELSGLVQAVRIGGREATALDPARLTCKGAQPVDCGPFGCKLSIYFEGVAPAFETYVKAWRARGGKLEIMRVGAYCKESSESCSETYRAGADGLELAARGEAKFDRDRAPKPMVRTARGDGAPAKSRAAGGPTGRRLGAGHPSTRGKFDAPSGVPDAAKAPAQTAPAAAPAPGVVAERRRRLDAAPYVP